MSEYSVNVSIGLNFVLNVAGAEGNESKTKNTTITSLFYWENKLYVGTDGGEVLLYSVEWNTDTQPATAIPRFEISKSVGKKQIDSLMITEANGEFLIVQCGNTVSVHSPGDLTLLQVVPAKNAILFTCNNASYMGLAVATDDSLRLYDLVTGFNTARTFNLPDAPSAIAWVRNYVCLAFQEEYTLLREDDGIVCDLCFTQSVPHPVVIPLPFEHLLLVQQKSAVIYDLHGNPKQYHKFLNQPTSLAFSFPFIFAVCEQQNCLEVRSVVDDVFHEVLRGPSLSHPLRLAIADGRQVFVATKDSVYSVTPQVNKRDYASVLGLSPSLVKSGDRTAISQFITGLLTKEPSPYRHLMMSYVYVLIESFPNPEKASLDEVKKLVNTALRRLYKTVVSYFKEFATQGQREIIYLIIQVIFFRHIYGTISAIVKEKTLQDDLRYQRKLRQLSKATMADLGIRTKFWLNQLSLDEERWKAISRKQNMNILTDGEATESTSSSDSKSILPESFTYFADGILYVAEADELVGTSSLVDTRNGSPVTLAQDSESVMHLVDNSTGTPTQLQIDDQFIFNETRCSVRWTHDKKVYELVINDRDSFTEFCTAYRLYECSSPSLTRSQSVIINSTRSSPVISKLIPAPQQEAQDDMHTDCINAIQASLPADSYKAEYQSNSNAEQTPSQKYTSVDPLLGVIPEVLPPDMLHGKMPQKTASSPIRTHKRTPSFPRDSRPIWPDEAEGWEPTTSKNRDAHIAVIDEENEPYIVPIRILRSITLFRSPQEKIACVLKALNSTAETVTKFWKEHGKDVILGADDLVPIFSYVVLKSGVRTMYSEQFFITEFASEASLRGRNGYSLATLQIAVDGLMRLEIHDHAESKELDIDDFEIIEMSSSPPRNTKEQAKDILKHVQSLSEQSNKNAGSEIVAEKSQSSLRHRHDNSSLCAAFSITGQTIVASFACSLDSTEPGNGWIYLTQEYVCFECFAPNSEKPAKKFIFRIDEIIRMRKMWTLLNNVPAIEVVTRDKKSYLFQGFVNRDEAYSAFERAVEQFGKCSDS